MHILVAHSWKLLTDHRLDGDGLIAYSMLRRLAERGHHLHVLAREVDLREPAPATMTIHALGGDGSDLGFRERVRYMRALRGLAQQLADRETVDVVHQTNPVDPGVTLALRRHGPPVVLGPYLPDWPPDRPLGVVGRLRSIGGRVSRSGVRAAQQRRAAALVLTTEAAREKVRVRTPPPVVALIPHGIDATRFALVPARPAGRPPTVLFLANLRAHKGIHTLLDAWVEVHRHQPTARLLVGGTGPEEEAVRRRVTGSLEGHGVEVLGAVDKADIASVMAQADVFCQPAHNEPYGTSAVEAMACGMPVVSTAAGGLAYVVPDGAGVRVAPADASALADGLLTVLGLADLGRSMGAVGRTAVAERYDWPRVLDRLEEVYAAVTAPGGDVAEPMLGAMARRAMKRPTARSEQRSS